MKQKSVLIYVAACVVIGIILALVRSQMSKDTPPEFSLNGTELDLSVLKVSDLNEAGFWLPNNNGTMPASSFKERLSYYHGEDRTISMGGISVLNYSSSKKPYADCAVFEITAKSRDKDGNLTGLQATYKGEEFFGKTKEELIALFGEPTEEGMSDRLIYRSEKKKYKTVFYFDTKTKECYEVEIDRKESNLAR